MVREVFQNGENKDKMVSGTSVKITNVSQVRHESQDCLATAVKKNNLAACVVTETLMVLPSSGEMIKSPASYCVNVHWGEMAAIICNV